MPEENHSDSLDYSFITNITGVDEAIKIQKEKLNKLREYVRKLEFKKIDVAGDYASIAFKAIDGGKMKINFNPFEINAIDVADSNRNRKLSFVFPEIKNYGDYEINEKEQFGEIINKIDEITIINKFVKLLGCKSISDISFIASSSDILMEIAEWACIFDRVTAESDEPIIILKDGLLRTKALKVTGAKNYINLLRGILQSKKKYVRLVGVSKTSAILSLLSVALFLEKKIPKDSVGYIKVPLDLELKAYEWSGKGRISENTPLNYAFGELYIAKLAKSSNLLVTIEVPKHLDSNKPIYTDEEVAEIISYLAKDSKYSYPIIGYPQTIMRAHEAAVQLGFYASIIKDELKSKILESLDKDAKEFVRDAWLIMDVVDKGNLGGGNYG